MSDNVGLHQVALVAVSLGELVHSEVDGEVGTAFDAAEVVGQLGRHVFGIENGRRAAIGRVDDGVEGRSRSPQLDQVLAAHEQHDEGRVDATYDVVVGRMGGVPPLNEPARVEKHQPAQQSTSEQLAHVAEFVAEALPPLRVVELEVGPGQGVVYVVPGRVPLLH